MVGTTKQALRFAENLSLPKVQVIVVRGNMSCNHCQRRVSDIIGKMNGLLDYVVDLRKKEVTIRGIVKPKNKRKKINKIPDPPNRTDEKKYASFFGLFRIMCFGAF